MKHIIFNVKCPYKEHPPLPYSVTVNESKNIQGSSVDIYCPFCDKYINVKIEGTPVDNTEIDRHYGFDKE
ncbi:MAG TPA: hypothetical protein VJL89_06910 [Thermodesulfovibrionia bacterium]|nr:hypothetical protein [Thermodesulfovibrionia bacterium]